MPQVGERLGTWLEVLKGARDLFGGEPFSAIVHLQRALKHEPSAAWVAKLLAVAYHETGDLGAAAEQYRRLTLLAPDDDGDLR